MEEMTLASAHVPTKQLVFNACAIEYQLQAYCIWFCSPSCRRIFGGKQCSVPTNYALQTAQIHIPKDIMMNCCCIADLSCSLVVLSTVETDIGNSSGQRLVFLTSMLRLVFLVWQSTMYSNGGHSMHKIIVIIREYID